MRSTNIFSMVGKALYNSVSGRIRWRSNMWALVGSRWDKHRFFGATSGELVRDDHVLVHRMCVVTCPAPPGDDFYVGEKFASVPRTECVKCPHHRHAQRGGFRFPRCVYQRAETGQAVTKQTLDLAGQLYTEAVNKARGLLDVSY